MLRDTYLWTLLVLLLAIPLGAQERAGSITGRLTDQSGGILPGVSVAVLNGPKSRTTIGTTDTAGIYFIVLEPGRYSIRFTLRGFARQEVPGVEVQLGRMITVNGTLQVGDTSEAVQVTAQSAPQIDTRSTVIAHNVTAEEMDRIPKARSFQGIAMTAPSVNQGEIEGGFQVNGASGAENAFTVDGVVTNSVINGSSRQNTVFEYIQEVQVKTTGIPAEHGGALGGVISAVTKSGGNVLHGEGHYYFQGSVLAAAPVKRLVLSPIDDKTVTYVQDKKQPEKQNEFGGSIGGPAVRDHLWFFGSVSPRYNRKTNTYEYNLGAEHGQVERRQNLMQLFGKLSYGSRRLNAYGTGLFTPYKTTGTHAAYNGQAPNYLVATAQADSISNTRGYKQSQTSTTGDLDIILSRSSFATVRGGYFYDNYHDTGIPSFPNYTYQRTSSTSVLPVPAQFQGALNTINTPRVKITNVDETTRAFTNVGYNQNFQAAGWHTLKGGVGYQHTVNDVDSAYPGGYIDIFWGSTLTIGKGGTGRYGYYAVNDNGTFGKVGANIISLFAQDEWQAGDRLTFNLGIRTEHEKVPTFASSIATAFDFGFGDKIAPRLGAAYDVKGDGKVKVFGSWGRYYDWTKYELSRGSFGGDFWKIYYRSLDDPALLPTLSLSNMPGADLWTVPGGAPYRNRRIPSTGAIDPNIRPMSQDSRSGGLDYQVNPRSVLSVHYVHNSLRTTIEDIGHLDASGNEGYLIGNPGEGAGSIQFATGLTPKGQPIPKPIRRYDAVQVGLDRRFSGNWYASANYTWSRLYGNYSGIASSDEIRTATTGVSSATAQQQAGSIFREGGNANRAYDIDEVLWDSHGNLDVKGLLATDRPHVVKLFGSYTAPFGTTFGAFQYAGSGTPISTYLETANQTEAFVNGRGDLGRTPFLTQTDLLISHDLKVMNGKTFRVEMNVLNLFNQKTARHFYNYINRGDGAIRQTSAPSLAGVDLTRGYDYNALILATPDGANAFDPRFKMSDLFNPGLQAYATAKFIF